jgi:hypothetical protein
MPGVRRAACPDAGCGCGPHPSGRWPASYVVGDRGVLVLLGSCRLQRRSRSGATRRSSADDGRSDRMHLTEVASGVVETDPVHVSEPARYYHRPDGRGLLRSRYEPRERKADAQFAAAEVEASERPASDSAADERLDGEGPDGGGVTGCEVAGLVFHFGSAHEPTPTLGSAARRGARCMSVRCVRAFRPSLSRPRQAGHPRGGCRCEQ